MFPDLKESFHLRRCDVQVLVRLAENRAVLLTKLLKLGGKRRVGDRQHLANKDCRVRAAIDGHSSHGNTLRHLNGGVESIDTVQGTTRQGHTHHLVHPPHLLSTSSKLQQGLFGSLMIDIQAIRDGDTSHVLINLRLKRCIRRLHPTYN
eukprot:1182512-Prorocentrum_minimum.AAC.2